MKRIKPHISISEELDNKIKSYQNDNKIKYYSDAVSEIILKGFELTNYSKQLDNILVLLERLNSKNGYIKNLLEQLYSNLEIETTTNPKNNKSLQNFKNKYLKDNYND